MQFYFHAGETLKENSEVKNDIYTAILMNPERIGHGLSLIRHPILIPIVVEKNICVEINPISNYVLGFVDNMKNHPLGNYINS